MEYNCLIIDDDEVARLKVLSLARNYPMLHILGHFSSVQAAMPVVEKNRIDILFLDIDMPKTSGLDFRKTMMDTPVCIFITSHPEHAVESFELEALDFIVKPLRPERFGQTMQRITEFLSIKKKADLYESSFGDDTIVIKEGYEQTRVKLHDILYLEALKDYTLLVTPTKRHCVFSGIGNLLKEDAFQWFIRVHRSYAVQKQFVHKIGTQQLTLHNGVSIPIGLSYKDNLIGIL
ncbi:LytR/AlgR family response regulator transcription factor [Flavobacterium sp.]|uniref:LytR/AlgR family response regulator transcription factor n=1 Tax=Flavobacterium sp. TaxID=239 RepID=UPI0039E305F0